MQLFVSYSRVDQPHCLAIVDLLRAHDVWFDHKLYGGDKWWDEIDRQLELCEGFVYLLSNESVSSKYCIREYEIAVERGKQIIPVFVRARTQIPERLKSLDEIHRIDLADITIYSVTELLNAVLKAERIATQVKKKVVPNSLHKSNLPFNYAYVLKKQASLSELTMSTYLRWTDDFLVTVALFAPSQGKQERNKRMENLPIGRLVESLDIAQIRLWLEKIVSSRSSSVGALQAKASKQLSFNDRKRLSKPKYCMNLLDLYSKAVRKLPIKAQSFARGN